MMLRENTIYTSTELLKLFGGNLQSSMPLVKGRVLYCKFNPRINPNFPEEAWIEEGPYRKKSAHYLINCNLEVPIFKKIKSNNWQYVGKATISDSSDTNRIKNINVSPPRNPVQIILKLHFNKGNKVPV
ncbi:hypothetical protein ACQUW5_05470 [Legionella sp. CNM-1927-20]|uniref:hypothetical protein n=1 Tax=Legionella sp. CNM-1927-20 TaxID=3422221 RepID=UPI00403AB865